MIFTDRKEAGKRLAARLKEVGLTKPVIIGLPRGGLPVAFEVARELDAPLDIVVVRKVGHPLQPEYGIGAVTEDDFYWIDPKAVTASEFDAQTLEKLLIQEAREVRSRVEAYRGDRPPYPLEGRTAVLVDDGLATGVSARAAAHLLRGRGATRVILAVPVAAASSAESLLAENVVDDLVALSLPEEFYAVGQWYEDFNQVTDQEALGYLARSEEDERRRREKSAPTPRSLEVIVPLGRGGLPGTLSLPAGQPSGVVVFAHGSGSSRLSPRNREVADSLVRAGIATFLFDLLTEDESESRENVFDVPLLGQRLITATDFLIGREELANLPLGYFGASTGVAAALWAAAEAPARVAAILGRGGRPDLAEDRLREVGAPVLLIVGSRDPTVLSLNQEALRELPHADLSVIRGATHLFEEPGALEEVSRQAIDWFSRHFEAERRGTRIAA
ncbi:MAG: phosphoribosyltransferase [Oligoflexia bacterium]|nr:phosphoribosyltransferase [Oligoflexia bacterium]